ncbi:TPA: hypothetical protein ACMDS1_003602 [Vibrio parahaemolyticus]|uniref:hypothetical protein n=1 Tax=Vibrio diabolicus TaxID=50719 RepID=UPI00211C0075|nr:hypothetical protein [Vibrio diabolicus]MCQ9247882.1 hypothetical protein [Vibrio diabolicus]
MQVSIEPFLFLFVARVLRLLSLTAIEINRFLSIWYLQEAFKNGSANNEEENKENEIIKISL